MPTGPKWRGRRAARHGATSCPWECWDPGWCTLQCHCHGADWKMTHHLVEDFRELNLHSQSHPPFIADFSTNLHGSGISQQINGSYAKIDRLGVGEITTQEIVSSVTSETMKVKKRIILAGYDTI